MKRQKVTNAESELSSADQEQSECRSNHIMGNMKQRNSNQLTFVLSTKRKMNQY